MFESLISIYFSSSELKQISDLFLLLNQLYGTHSLTGSLTSLAAHPYAVAISAASGEVATEHSVEGAVYITISITVAAPVNNTHALHYVIVIMRAATSLRLIGQLLHTG